MQVVASMVKVPALFFLTLLVTLPSLYVFNALVGSRLTLAAVVRLLVATLGVIVAVLASLGPIVAFFSVSTTSYPFILLFNVRRLRRLGLPGDALSAPDPAPAERGPARRRRRRRDARRDSPASQPSEAPSGALDRHRRPGAQPARKTIFRLWLVVFGLVGAQMGWVFGRSWAIPTCRSPGSAAGSPTSFRPCSRRS